ncbi:MAG: anthranilate synthase component I [Pyrinomonadaceae bacterium]
MLELQPSTFDEFQRETTRGNVVPVVRTVLADLQTPVGAFLRVAEGAKYAFLLESVEGGERVARYSFLGAQPEMVVRGRGKDTVVERWNDAGEMKIETLAKVRVTDFLRDHFRRRKLARRAGVAPFAGGAVGYLAYESVRWFEPVLDVGYEAAAQTDDAVFMFYRTLLAFDRVRQQIEIISVVFTEEANGDALRLKALYENAVRETERLEKKLTGELPLQSTPDKTRHEKESHVEFASNWTQHEFEQAVLEIKERIAAGDCYQVVLSQCLRANVSASPVEIYRALRATNPSPYMYFLQLGDEAIVGASPEMLVRCRGQRLDYRPIAGTRKRGATETEDWLLGEDMKTDEKEVAEHTMLVDLGRNDLGRVADYGSVEIDELMAIEKFSHVQHLVTYLRARLRDGFDRFDALASVFPAGTLTGAPKVRAMQLIRALEPHARGIYGGTVLYADYADNLDSCIVIRTVHLRADEPATIQTGAGIVADSVPEREYEETLNKARAVMRAIEMAELGL